MRIGLGLAERDTANRKPAGEARQRPQMPQQQTLIGLSSPALSVTVITALTAAPSYALHRPDLNHSKARGHGGKYKEIRRWLGWFWPRALRRSCASCALHFWSTSSAQRGDGSSV